MSIQGTISLKCTALICLFFFLALSFKVLWQLEKSSPLSTQKYLTFLNNYQIQRHTTWSNPLAPTSLPSTPFIQTTTHLTISSEYLTLLPANGQPAITDVITLPSDTPSRHFVLQSELSQQVYFYDHDEGKSSVMEGREYKMVQKCVDLDNVEMRDKVTYFADEEGKVWVVTHPHHNVLFVQVFDCRRKRLIARILHQPKIGGRVYMINEIIKVEKLQNGLYQVKLLTYQSHEYLVQVTATATSYHVSSSTLTPSYIITPSRTEAVPSSIPPSPATISYTFHDSSHHIPTQQFQHLLFSLLQDFTAQIKTLLNSIGVSARTLNAYINAMMRQNQLEEEPQYFDFDIQLVDQSNGCMLGLQYGMEEGREDGLQQGGQGSNITRLGKYILPTRTPVFHSVQDYDKYNVLQILKKQKSPKFEQYKRISVVNGFQQQYESQYFYSLYKTLPQTPFHYLGVGQKTFSLYPPSAPEFFQIRTHTGGLVMQGSTIKGAYEDKPVQQEQIQQRYYIEANEVKPGVFEAHAGYRALYSSVKGSTVELVNGLSGKGMMVVRLGQGLKYAGCWLFNNQWWVAQYNPTTHTTSLTKHQLYTQSAYPKQISSVSRTYGRLVDSEFQDGEDDLAMVFKDYLEVYGGNGLVVLDLIRCIDQFYYFVVCDAQGGNYAIVRVHYKRLSNRMPKKNGDYQNELQRQLIVEPNKMVKQTQKMDPFMIVLQNLDHFKDFKKLIQQNKIHHWRKYATKSSQNTTIIHSQLQKHHQSTFLPYQILSKQYPTVSQASTNQKSQSSTQQITLINMRVLIQNAKKKFIIETRQLAKSRLKYLLIFLIVIFFSLVVKILLRKQVAQIKIEQQNEVKNQLEQVGLKKGSGEKSKTKKTKTN